MQKYKHNSITGNNLKYPHIFGCKRVKCENTWAWDSFVKLAAINLILLLNKHYIEKISNQHTLCCSAAIASFIRGYNNAHVVYLFICIKGWTRTCIKYFKLSGDLIIWHIASYFTFWRPVVHDMIYNLCSTSSTDMESVLALLWGLCGLDAHGKGFCSIECHQVRIWCKLGKINY